VQLKIRGFLLRLSSRSYAKLIWFGFTSFSSVRDVLRRQMRHRKANFVDEARFFNFDPLKARWNIQE
jgi:hypothetical protein